PEARPLLGPAGAWLARALLGSLGVAVYVFLAGWFVFVLLLLLRRAWLTWILRLFGWLLLVPSTAVLAERLAPRWKGAPLEGAGGSLGVWLSLWLDAYFHPVGQVVILTFGAFLGMVLALDMVLKRLVRLGGRGLRMGWRLRGLRFPTRR